MIKIIVIGGGAAGFMSAIECASRLGNKADIIILERGKNVLEKVRISGGGRCNVTNKIFEPKDLVKFYPRGEKELLSPFHQFNSKDTMEWFRKNGVKLKTESDGRVFPVTDNSETIVRCLLQQAQNHNISVITGSRVDKFYFKDEHWIIHTNHKIYQVDYLICTPGSSPAIWEILKNLGHSIIPPVPSLFTFNIQHPILNGLMGVSHEKIIISCKELKIKSSGALLITHWGLSGPAILRLSAWGARVFHENNYQFEICINWSNLEKNQEVEELISIQKSKSPKQKVVNAPMFDISSRLWISICKYSGIETERWVDLNKLMTQNLIQNLFNCTMKVNGKSTNKDEFVTA